MELQLEPRVIFSIIIVYNLIISTANQQQCALNTEK